MQKTLSTQLVKTAYAPAVFSGNTSDLITTICDMGDCQNATAIIAIDYTDAITAIRFWTSSSDSCITSTTAQTATTNTVQVAITSDDDSLQSWNGNTRVTNLSVTDNTIATVAADQTITVELPNIRRYLACQFNGHGTSSVVSMTFIGRDPSGSERPWTAARAEY